MASITKESSHDDEMERFLPESSSKEMYSRISSQVTKKNTGARRNKRSLCVLVVIGLASLVGLAWWMVNRGRKPPQGTIIQTSTNTKVYERSSTSNTAVNVKAISQPQESPPKKVTAELIPSKLTAEEAHSLSQTEKTTVGASTNVQDGLTVTSENTTETSLQQEETPMTEATAQLIQLTVKPEVAQLSGSPGPTEVEAATATVHENSTKVSLQGKETLPPKEIAEVIQLTAEPIEAQPSSTAPVQQSTIKPNIASSSPEEGPTFGSQTYLNRAEELIKTAMSAILEESGQVTVGYYNDKNFISIPRMFAWDRLDMTNATEAPEAFRRRGNRGNAGWTSDRSWKGLVLRLVQAMSQQSDFTVVLGGHSAAAGHGNHFRQSYMMQFHKVMAPVLRQLGVNLISRNQAQGGLGTVHSSLGFSSIYGSDIDLMLWDSGMTENHSPEHIDLFFRQALLAEGRVPVVWSAGQQFDMLQMLHNEADADVGEFGIGWDGVPETTDEEQVEGLPWAVRHLKCSEERRDLCKHPHKFCATCWINRKDRIRPAQTQYDPPHGQVRWHPGWRQHQLTGRVLAFSILQALQDAVRMIGCNSKEQLTNTLDMTKYYDNIRRKVQSLDPSLGRCHDIKSTLPDRICRTSMKGRTQYTPRANAVETSITSTLKPAPDGYVPLNNRRPLYEGPDAHNRCFDLPEGAVDVVAKIERLENTTVTGTRHLVGGFVTAADRAEGHNQTAKAGSSGSIAISAVLPSVTDTEVIVPGLGWQVFDEPQGICDGTYDSVCAKSTRNRCVLYGHHDERGAVLGSELSGWLVMQLPRDQVKEGIIVLKLHTWYEAGDNPRTHGWTTINNVPREEGNVSQEIVANQTSSSGDEEPEERHLMGPDRSLRHRDYKTPALGEWFQFDYAIDGVVTTLDNPYFFKRKKDISSMVEVLTLLDDPSYGGKHQDASSHLEVAIRMRGCGRRCVFGVTHIYWA